MNEIYWITRFDGINTIFITFLVISTIASALFIIVYIVNYCNEQECSEVYKEEYKSYQKLGTKFLKITIPIFIVSCLGVIFVPTTKQALLIYGVGGTIDYVKTNPTAKQLPDKCIKALDKWVDSWAVEEKKSDDKK